MSIDWTRLMSGVAMLVIFVTAYVGGKEERMLIKIPYIAASFVLSVVIAKYFAHHYLAIQNAATYVMAHLAVMLLFVFGVGLGSIAKEQ